MRGVGFDTALVERASEGLVVAAHGRGHARGGGRGVELRDDDPRCEPQTFVASVDELPRGLELMKSGRAGMKLQVVWGEAA